MAIAICKYSECSKSDQCLRFSAQDGEEMLFQNICKESNSHKWFLQDDTKIQTVEKVDDIEKVEEDANINV